MHIKSSYILDIEQKLEVLSPILLNVTDDSHKHQGHLAHRGNDAATHLSIRIISEQFRSLSRIARHRVVYKLLRTEIETHVHALAIEALTPEEAKDL